MGYHIFGLEIEEKDDRMGKISYLEVGVGVGVGQCGPGIR